MGGQGGEGGDVSGGGIRQWCDSLLSSLWLWLGEAGLSRPHSKKKRLELSQDMLISGEKVNKILLFFSFSFYRNFKECEKLCTNKARIKKLALKRPI